MPDYIKDAPSASDVPTCDIEIEGKTYTMLMDMNVLCEIEQTTGHNLAGVKGQLNLTFTDLLKISLCCIKPRHPEMTREKLGKLLTPANATILFNAIPILTNNLSADSHALGPKSESPTRVIEEVLDVAEAKRGELLVDLGCGEGQVLRAALLRGLNVVGVELDKQRALQAEELCESTLSENTFKIVRGPLQDLKEIEDADIIYIHLDKSAPETLKDLLVAKCKQSVRIVSITHPFPSWTPTITKTVRVMLGDNVVLRYPIYLYRIAEALTVQ